jgi:predicted MPP superfamily phosphohydrolase
MLFYTYLSGIIFIVYAAKVIAVLFLFIADMVRVAQHSYRYSRQKKNRTAEPGSGKKITRARFIQNIGLIGGGLMLSGLIIGMIKWAYDFKIKMLGLTLPNLPSSFNGFKIVQISDIHLGSWTQPAALDEAISRINNLEADIIVFTGDLVNFSTGEAYPYEDSLRRLRARHGVYTILGNHDYGDYVAWDTPEEKQQNMDDLVHFYQRIGWTLLKNENAFIRRNEDNIALIGVENWSAISRFPKYGRLSQAIEGAGEAPVKILLSHDPTHWDAEVRPSHKDIDLTLSGHTHGFQFGLEWKNLRWSPAQYMYKQWAGLYDSSTEYGDQYLYVNRGLGNVGYPGRIGILPEITLITLYNV